MCIQIFGKLIAEAGWNARQNLLRDQNTGKIHDKSCFWAEKAIETVKYFKYFKLYEFWSGNFASWFRVCTGGGKFCGETNLMLIDSWERSFSERFVKNERFIDFSHFSPWHDSLRLCCAPWSGKLKVRWFLFFVSFRCSNTSCFSS